MGNFPHEQQMFYWALYLLRKKFDTPNDLIIYWAFSGPCLEPHPEIEDYVEKI